MFYMLGSMCYCILRIDVLGVGGKMERCSIQETSEEAIASLVAMFFC